MRRMALVGGIGWLRCLVRVRRGQRRKAVPLATEYSWGNPLWASVAAQLWKGAFGVLRSGQLIIGTWKVCTVLCPLPSVLCQYCVLRTDTLRWIHRGSCTVTTVTTVYTPYCHYLGVCTTLHVERTTIHPSIHPSSHRPPPSSGTAA